MSKLLVFCELPLQQMKASTQVAANQPNLFDAPAQPIALHANVQLLRRPHDPDRTRFALSGKMSDVCQTLDRLAQQESEGGFRQAGLN